MQLRLGRRDQNPEKDGPVTLHFIVTVSRCPEVSKVSSITQLCGLRVTVEKYTAPKEPLQCKRCQSFGHTQCNCGYAPRCVAVERLTSQVSARLLKSRLNAGAARILPQRSDGPS